MLAQATALTQNLWSHLAKMRPYVADCSEWKCLLQIAIVGLLVSFASGTGIGGRVVPYLAPSWSADFRLNVGTIFSQSHGFYFHDRPHLRNRQILTLRIGLFRPRDVAQYDLLNRGLWHNVTLGRPAEQRVMAQCDVGAGFGCSL
ncbi:unnamed protein product [Polarella glacialis]|uniref:Uncharacterized protein n=1 Tax=Polarella glacialis TaxID=89957 RepID=A0A813JCL4_POLGL|nr:unnamed protein product [Polarella glacialis]